MEVYFGEGAELLHECSLEHRGVSTFGDIGNGWDEINKLKKKDVIAPGYPLVHLFATMINKNK